MRRPLAAFMALAFMLLIMPLQELAVAAPRGSGALVGHIFNEDMKTPVRNAVVKLRNLITQQEFESEPTDQEGMYRIPGLEEGRYVMGVIGPRGSYNFHYSIMIRGNALAKLSVAMKPEAAPVRLTQGSESAKKRPSIVEFFKSPAGIVVLVTAAEMTLFALVLKEEAEVSPIID